MIGVIFEFGTENVEVRVDGNNVFFRTTTSQNFADIDGIKLDKSGVMKEFPDLIGRDDWQSEARLRFKDKIHSYLTEEEKMKYIMADLIKYGYVPRYIQKQGFRPQKL